MNRMEKAWAGERLVKHLLEADGWYVVDLAPSWPCDLLGIRGFGWGPSLPFHRSYDLLWVEVKVKTPYRPRLTPPERTFLLNRKAQGDRVLFYWLKREGDGFRVTLLPVDPP